MIEENPLITDIQNIIHPDTILLTYRGSIAHGTHVENTDPDSIDDIDYIGVTIPDIKYYFGLKYWGNSGTREVIQGDIDLVEYEIKKLFNLMLNCNPNLMALFWCKPEHILFSNELGVRLRGLADHFLTKKIYSNFMGYAQSQFKHMLKRKFDLAYKSKKRAMLFEKFGYDTKNAAHTIRILRMGCEMLESGRVNVCREGIDAGELQDIKGGKWSFQDILNEKEKLERRASIAFAESELPLHVDSQFIEDEMIDMITIAQFGDH